MYNNNRYFSTDDSPYWKEGHNRKRYEVFFRYVFTSVYPHRQAPSYYQCDLAIPVNRISHVTHNKEARGINRGDQFVFRTTSKTGKAYTWDGSPIGESFRDNFLKPKIGEIELNPDEQQHKYIPRQESVMPEGYYSWWGIASDCMNGNQHPALLQGRADGICPPYLQDPPGSPYGNVEFSGSLHQLLQSYQSIHTEDPANPTKVYLLLGGTLRYKREICCVVIVCAEGDRKSEALKDYKPIPLLDTIPEDGQDPVLLLGGLTDTDGIVQDYSGLRTPLFYPRFISSSASWANLTFAFYCQQKEVEFNFPGLSCGNIYHNQDRCIRKRPKPYNGSWACPNNL